MTKFGVELTSLLTKYTTAGISPRVLAMEMVGAALAYLGLKPGGELGEAIGAAPGKDAN